MFAIIDDILQVLPDTIVRNGFTYNDLWDQTNDYLANLGIYRLPEMPVYDLQTQKLEVDLATKSWVIVDLTPEEIENNTAREYETMYIRNYNKYLNYNMLLEDTQDEPQIVLQLQQYILDILDYCLSIKLRQIPLSEIIEYPEPVLEHFYNRIK